ncbi:MAG: hypothetical protein OXM56_03315 [Gammaproteobacteria bacterium]|nr:hypothetical protein [Gammaproteobacteria bacterium]
MAQPVIDTLAVADALRRTGMEREQAEGVARTLGTELGAHVAVQRDLNAGFAGIRAQMDTRFAEVDARFAQVDARFTRVEAEIHAMGADLRALGAHIEALGDRLTGLDGQFKFGFGLLAAMLAVVIGMIGVLHA